MSAKRMTKTDSGSNLSSILNNLEDKTTRKVIFYGSRKSGGSWTDGSAITWPLMAALVEDSEGNLGVYDGVFLTASSHHRYLEVQQVLDAALEAGAGKVYFAPEPIPFTSHETAAVAADVMLSVQIKEFDQVSRVQYFKLLSNMNERQFAEMNE
ncbi:hypothetical protein PRJ_5465 (plasmid) [Pseudomonas sp. XWY-1]|uniref:hypothetical protein n=1 Tax=Pseudomonas sp. XWY-1 TaxID=2069256 RepID=UPI000CDC4D75|nr:hypothetical protein [Pseudomonas sp. XWY-1]AUZ62023.1 hypothetical protein PRJ_5465 [Pseudomonas sp. XWY-1]